MWGEALTALLIAYAFALGWLIGRRGHTPGITVSPVFYLGDPPDVEPDDEVTNEEDDPPPDWRKPL